MASTPQAPGIYRQPLAPIRAPGQLARGDVPVILGFAVRGPVNAPARIYSMAQFEAVFGPPNGYGFLYHAVKGFFENGGRAAYVVRIATEASAAASASLPSTGDVAWKANASFPWTMIDPRRLAGIVPLEAAGWLQVFERQLAHSGKRSDDPGSWGNGLALGIARTSLARTRTIEATAFGDAASLLESLAGIEEHSVLELTQQTGASLRRRRAIPAAVDRDRSVVRWSTPGVLSGFDLARPIRVSSVEFEVRVFQDNEPVQHFAALSPHPEHSLALASTLESECRLLALQPVARTAVPGGWVESHGPHGAALLEAADWTDERNWPPEGHVALAGGTDGLDSLAARHWLAALRQVADVADAALVACPDAVLPPITQPSPATQPPAPGDCDDLSPRPTAHLAGQVLGIQADGSIIPVAGAVVDAAGPGGQDVTDQDGRFLLDPVPAGVLQLRLRHPDYAPLDVPAQSTIFRSAEPLRFHLSQLSVPAPLDEQAILSVYRAMGDPAVVGPYKMAVLDNPRADDQLDQLLSWRARLGDSGRCLLAAPWLLLPSHTGSFPAPACGHVAGAYAAAELAGGIHHSGANRALRYVDGTCLAIGDEAQGLLNPQGINAVRVFAGRGIRLYGSRTLSRDRSWQYATVRRLVDAIEKSVERILQPIVFEPNNAFTRNYVSSTVQSFLGRLHRSGALAGSSPEGSFAVRSDEVNNPPSSQEAGQLLIEVDVAPAVPYEFITFRIGHAFDALAITEET